MCNGMVRGNLTKETFEHRPEDMREGAALIAGGRAYQAESTASTKALRHEGAMASMCEEEQGGGLAAEQ